MEKQSVTGERVWHFVGRAKRERRGNVFQGGSLIFFFQEKVQNKENASKTKKKDQQQKADEAHLDVRADSTHRDHQC